MKLLQACLVGVLTVGCAAVEASMCRLAACSVRQNRATTFKATQTGAQGQTYQLVVNGVVTQEKPASMLSGGVIAFVVPRWGLAKGSYPVVIRALSVEGPASQVAMTLTVW